jgi:hypothetical protein
MSTTTEAIARDEQTVMTVWPSISAGRWGRWLGRLFANRTGVRLSGVPITWGWTLVILTIPLTLFLYLNKIVPRIPFVLLGWKNQDCRRYRLTSERLVVDHPFYGDEYSSIRLDEFDTSQLEARPGHIWFRAADIVFRRGPREVFRLAGVPHAEAFRQTCMKTKIAQAGVLAARRSIAQVAP